LIDRSIVSQHHRSLASMIQHCSATVLRMYEQFPTAPRQGIVHLIIVSYGVSLGGICLAYPFPFTEYDL